MILYMRRQYRRTVWTGRCYRQPLKTESLARTYNASSEFKGIYRCPVIVEVLENDLNSQRGYDEVRDDLKSSHLYRRAEVRASQ